MHAVKVLSITLVVILGFSTFNASAESTTADVAACINKNTGTVRIAQMCSPRETPFQWIINGLTGKSGPRGAQILTGKDAPELTTKNIGEIGDFYISTIDSTLYGPKSDKGWPKTGVKLQGAAGINGSNGGVGPQGPTGPTGGTVYTIGQTGPGGGKIFMLPTTAGNTSGKYFEAALDDSSSGIAWCSIDSTALGATVGLAGTGAIGNGSANTALMLARCTTGAAYSAFSYISPNNTADWFLPSKGELNQMFVNKTSIGGFAGSWYWSSSESNATFAWGQLFSLGETSGNLKSQALYVRPVRAFSP